MSKATLQEILGGESKGALSAAMEGIRAVAPGLSLSNILSDIGSEIQQIGAHGAHEMAAALFSGSGFVMYPRDGGQQAEDPQHGLPIEAMKPPEIQQERGGMEM